MTGPRWLTAGRLAELAADLGHSRSLLAFDFDGTLAPIVADRNEAVMAERTARRLADVSARYDTAVITGRSLSDIAPRIAGATVRWIIGNHGLEPDGDLDAAAHWARQMRAHLHAQLENVTGVSIEDKTYSLAVHYREARDQHAARVAIEAALAASPLPRRVVAGKAVVNVLPPGAMDKGEALRHLAARADVEAVLFVGDDVTDEDVFRLTDVPGLITIRVGLDRASAAQYAIESQPDVDGLLDALLSARSER